MPQIYLENLVVSSPAWRMSEFAPAATDLTTKVTPGKIAVSNFLPFKPGQTVASGATSFIEADATGCLGWRSEYAYRGVFNSGVFTIYYNVCNAATRALSGIIQARLYHTPYPHPISGQLTRMQSGNWNSLQIGFSTTSGQLASGSFNVPCDMNLTLTSEYIFLILNWMVRVVGGYTTCSLALAVNAGAPESIVSPALTSSLPKGAICIKTTTGERSIASGIGPTLRLDPVTGQRSVSQGSPKILTRADDGRIIAVS